MKSIRATVLHRKWMKADPAYARAYAELGEDFRPKAVARATVESKLQADSRLVSTKADYVRRLEGNGLLVRRQSGTEETIEYILDPLAECLAAFEHARQCGSDTQRWSALISEVAQRGENARGFMLALRMNHAAYARALGFPPVEFL